jgi:integrase
LLRATEQLTLRRLSRGDSRMAGRRGHGDGGIDEPYPGHYRLRWRVDGRRHSKIFQGSLGEARRELRRLLKTADDGEHVAPDRQRVADYLRDWLGADTRISPKTRERYQQLAERQIIPHLGAALLQKLKPSQIDAWHSTLLKGGLHPRTVGHAHRVLHRGLERAVTLEIISRNVAHAVKPPRVESEEVEILSAKQVGEVLSRLDGHPLHPIVVFALATGMRRGEICGLQWCAVDLDKGMVRVERAIEETEGEGLRVKAPKTIAGRRSISLPPHAVEMLRAHWGRQVELRLQLGIGGRPEDWVFPGSPDGSRPSAPDKLSRDWGNVVRDRKLPRVMFHALRHTHASALIAAGQDIVSISKRLGHSSPAITLRVYSHLFSTAGDAAAAEAIERLFKS